MIIEDTPLFIHLRAIKFDRKTTVRKFHRKFNRSHGSPLTQLHCNFFFLSSIDLDLVIFLFSDLGNSFPFFSFLMQRVIN